MIDKSSKDVALTYWVLVSQYGNILYRDSIGIILPHSLVTTSKWTFSSERMDVAQGARSALPGRLP